MTKETVILLRFRNKQKNLEIYDRSAERIEFCKLHRLRDRVTQCHLCYNGFVIVNGQCMETKKVGLKGCRVLNDKDYMQFWECRVDHYQYSHLNPDCRVIFLADGILMR
jgi:hypothetical protein